MQLEEVIQFLRGRAIAGEAGRSKFGWIPDPTDNYGF